MNFAEAWDTFPIGARLAVSDGSAPPSNSRGPAFFAWRSHNFTGTLIEKIDGDYRGLKIEMDPANGAIVAYTVAEAVPHQFAEA